MHKNNTVLIYPDKEYFLPLDYDSKEASIFEVKNALPIIRFANKFSIKENEDEINKALIGLDKVTNLDNYDLFLLKEDGIDIKENNEKFDGKIYDIKQSNNILEFKYQSNKDNFIVLASNYHDGWRLYIDNIESKVYKANYYQKAIKAEKGNHNIKLIFEPKSYTLGRNISLTFIFLSFGFYFWFFYSPKKEN